MSRTYRRRKPDDLKSDQRIRVRGVRRDPPDLRRLARALIELAQLQAEADAEKQHRREGKRAHKQPPQDPSRPPKSTSSEDAA